MQIQKSGKPWYKETWAWFLLGILGMGVAHGTTLLVVALNHQPSMVVDNYYDAGKGINKSLERERLAQRLGISSSFSLHPDDEYIRLQLNGDSKPALLTLNLISPTQPKKDRKFVLQPVNDSGLYQGLLQEEISGRRIVELLGQQDGEDWRLLQESIEIAANQQFELSAR